MRTRIPLTLATIFLAGGLTAAGAQTAADHNAHHPAPPPPATDAAGTPPSAASAGMPMDKSKMMGGGMGQMMQMMTAMAGGRDGSAMMPFTHIEGRIAFLKTELAVTDAQLPQWNAFADALRAGARNARETMAHGTQSSEPSTATARLDATVRAKTARLESLKAIAVADRALYEALTDRQKATADELLAGPVMGMGPMTGMMGGSAP